MKLPFNTAAFHAKMAARRKPNDPVDHHLPHVVTLPAPTSCDEQIDRWDKPQQWCRQNVDHSLGHQWSRGRNVDTGEIKFTFNDPNTGVVFALMFR